MTLRSARIFAALAVAALVTAVLTVPAWAAEAGTAALESGIRVIRDVPYVSGGGPAQQLDLYLPETATGRRPLVLLIHGGGWNAGDKQDFAGPCEEFVRRGYAAASMNYRLSRQAIFPAQIQDCKSAVRWLRAHADTYGFDSRRFVAGGHSAGGHLAALLGVTGAVKAFDVGENLRERSDVQAVLWFAGVGDFVSRVRTPGYESEQDPHSGQSLLIGGAVLENQDRAMAASPIHYVSRKSAPFLFFHGDSDKTVPYAQAVEMCSVLQAKGVFCELHPLKGADHGGPGYFTPGMFDQIDAFLRKTLK